MKIINTYTCKAADKDDNDDTFTCNGSVRDHQLEPDQKLA
jgi:hypothetical protein